MQAELYWIEGPWPGRLAIVPRPRGGDWLEEEIAAWRRVSIEAVISTLTKEEIAELDLAREEEFCRKEGIEWIAFPIPDRAVPSSTSAALDLIHRLEQLLVQGQRIAIHCRQGVGRRHRGVARSRIRASNGNGSHGSRRRY